MTIQVLSMPEKKSYNILSNLTVDVELAANPYHLPIDSVFEMAARNNPKRSYLFVSKLIGKHIPVLPTTPLRTGYLLASRFAELLEIPIDREVISKVVRSLAKNEGEIILNSAYPLPGKALFIGFAETATGLGHAVFENFTGEVNFLHTTREPLAGVCDTIYFTEDHCHAPDQKLLVNEPELLRDNDYLVLIDDEITTGNLCLNIIRSIQKKYPQQHYIILSLLDWRSVAAKQKYQGVATELGVKIIVVSLIAGTFTVKGTSPVIADSPQPLPGKMPEVSIFVNPLEELADTNFGRFGIDEKDNNLLKKATGQLGSNLAKLRHGERTLCLGTGEFMHIPILVADSMGKGVVVQSTTRSPVHPMDKENYAVQHAISFNDPHHDGVTNFVYNIPPNHYEEVFVFWERPVSPQQVKPLVLSLQELGINQIVFVWMTR